MTSTGFFGELKRRNVYKIAVAYAIVGWLLVQIAPQVFPFLEIPTWVVRLVIALVAIGFPLALIIAWAFELTPVVQSLACIALYAQATHAAATAAKPAFVFGGIGYLHRWSMNDQHEFTPQGQEDLEKWSDMVTINVYPSAHDGEALAAKANAVVENYKSHNGMVLRTNSVPRTPDRPAEHFVAVVFGRPSFIEVAFTRFKLVDGIGCSIVYSHRIYGEKVGDQMSAWLNQNGTKMEKILMEWNDIPSPTTLRELPRKEGRPSDAKALSLKS